MERVADPFSSLRWTARIASSSGRSIKYSSLSFSSSSLMMAISFLAYSPESMPCLIQPPTPSATTITFLDTNSASSPPFQTLSGWGADPQANLNSNLHLLSPPVQNIFFLFSLFILRLYMIVSMRVALCLCLILSVATYTKILSQEFFTQGFSDNDFNLWSPFGTALPLMKFSNCSGNRVFGGYNIFTGNPTNPAGIIRTWTGLIAHHSVRITAKLYKIDSWVNNTLFVMVDGQTAKLYTFNAANGGSTDICGNPSPVADPLNTNFNEVIISLDVTVAHSSSSLTIKIISNLMGSLGSWAVRDLNIILQACDQSCLTCNATSCTSCDTAAGFIALGSFCACSVGGTFVQKVTSCSVMPCATCVSICSAGFYYSAVTGACQPCNPACSSCINSPVNSASTCNGCSIGFVGTPPTTACSSCFSGCAACSSVSSTSCSSCLYGYFLHLPSGSCLTSCPLGWYSQEKAGLCMLCSTPCANCIGNNGGGYYCLSCVTGYYYYSFGCTATCPNSMYAYNGTCLSSCPQSTFPDVSLTCQPCIIDCLECSNATACFLCASGKFWMNGLCLTSCTLGYYGSSSTGLCITCHADCLSCNGPFLNQCLSCPGAAVLLNGACYTTCPASTYSALCLPCDSTCLTCSSSGPNACITCPAPYFFHINYTSCVNSCQQGQSSNNYNLTCMRCLNGFTAYFGSCVSCSPTCLTCFSPSFLGCESCNPSVSHLISTTCADNSDTRQVFSPHLSNTSLVKIIATLLVIHLLLSLLLELFFEYKTNLLITIELLQMLSYTFLLSIELSSSTQSAALLIYYTNFAALINPLSMIASSTLPPKFRLIGKTGIFLADALGCNIVMVVVVLIFFVLRWLGKRSTLILKLYNKTNPYLISYTFRLIVLDLSINAAAYLYCFDVKSSWGVLSLLLLIADAILIVAACFWRIRTAEDGSQIALFYFNEVGQKSRSQQYQEPVPDQQGLQSRIKSNRLLPSLMLVVGKIPIPITILLFIGSPRTQCICMVMYFCFALLIGCMIPYRRRIYRVISLISHCSLLLSSIVALFVAILNISSFGLQWIWLLSIAILFFLSFMQLITNYQFFVHFFSYLCHSESKSTTIDNSHANLNPNDLPLEVQNIEPVIFDQPKRNVAPSIHLSNSNQSSYLQLTNSRNSHQNINLDQDL